MRALFSTIVLGVLGCGAGVAARPAPPRPAPAPARGVIIGWVSGSSPARFFLEDEGPPVHLANVEVTATSPALAQPHRTTTDPAGRFRLPDLPIGTYQLTFKAASGEVAHRRDVQVSSTHDTPVTITMQRQREHIEPVCIYFQTCWW